jgi:hypothetical protein
MTRPLCSENWAILCGRANVYSPIEPLQLRSLKKKEDMMSPTPLRTLYNVKKR